MDKTTIAVGVV